MCEVTCKDRQVKPNIIKDIYGVDFLDLIIAEEHGHLLRLSWRIFLKATELDGPLLSHLLKKR